MEGREEGEWRREERREGRMREDGVEGVGGLVGEEAGGGGVGEGAFIVDIRRER